MQQNPQLSIVTISLNQGRFLGEAISSVNAIASLEYVIVDAGSSDGSRDVILSNGARISHMIFEADEGPADGLNKGFTKCTGEIFGYLNSDDRYVPGALDYVVRFFHEHLECDGLFGAAYVIDEEGRRRKRKLIPDKYDLQSAAGSACFVYCPSMFFRREAFRRCGGFNPRNHSCWDAELTTDLALAGASLHSSDVLLGEFRIHPKSLTGSKRGSAQFQADTARIERKIKEAGIPACSAAALPKLLGRTKHPNPDWRLGW